MSGGRAPFDAVLAGQATGRPAWVPLLDELAARLQSVSYREMSADPDLWSSGLTRAGELLGADALIVGCDATPSAPRQAAQVEVLRRLHATARARFGIVAAVCGPLRLATELFAQLPVEEALRNAKVAHNELFDAVLATRPDLVMLIERPAEPAGDAHRAWLRGCGTLRNLAAHYDVPLALRAEDWREEQIAGLGATRVPVYLLGRGSGDVLQAARALGPFAVGVPLPVAAGADPLPTLAAVVAARTAGSNWFLTTAGAVGGQGDLDALREIAAELQRRAA